MENKNLKMKKEVYRGSIGAMIAHLLVIITALTPLMYFSLTEASEVLKAKIPIGLFKNAPLFSKVFGIILIIASILSAIVYLLVILRKDENPKLKTIIPFISSILGMLAPVDVFLSLSSYDNVISEFITLFYIREHSATSVLMFALSCVTLYLSLSLPRKQEGKKIDKVNKMNN